MGYFVLGLVIGGCLGVLVMALMTITSTSDDHDNDDTHDATKNKK